MLATELVPSTNSSIWICNVQVIPHISMKVRRWLKSCIPDVMGYQNELEQIVTTVRSQSSTLYSTQTVRFRTGVPFFNNDQFAALYNVLRVVDVSLHPVYFKLISIKTILNVTLPVSVRFRRSRFPETVPELILLSSAEIRSLNVPGF